MQFKANLSLRESGALDGRGPSGRMLIVVSPQHVQLADLLREEFTGEAVRVIVDRRCQERRRLFGVVFAERRREERRQGRQLLIEAIVEV